MGKIIGILKNKDVGAIGIGAMIVFIAMVLVAGIAASVLVQTANKLEIQAMTTGSETTDEVATGVTVTDIMGQKATSWNVSYNASGNNQTVWQNTTLTNMTISIQPRAGSRDVDLGQAVIEISNSTVKCILTYASAEPDFAASAANGGIFSTTDDGSSTSIFQQGANEFGIIEIEDADNSCSEASPVINRGDSVSLTVNLTALFSGLSERTDVWGMVIPEDGSAGMFSFRTPPSFAADTVYDLY